MEAIDLWSGGDLPAVSECLICGAPILAGEPEAQRVVGAAEADAEAVAAAAGAGGLRLVLVAP